MTVWITHISAKDPFSRVQCCSICSISIQSHWNRSDKLTKELNGLKTIPLSREKLAKNWPLHREILKNLDLKGPFLPHFFYQKCPKMANFSWKSFLIWRGVHIHINNTAHYWLKICSNFDVKAILSEMKYFKMQNQSRQPLGHMIMAQTPCFFGAYFDHFKGLGQFKTLFPISNELGEHQSLKI